MVPDESEGGGAFSGIPTHAQMQEQGDGVMPHCNGVAGRETGCLYHSFPANLHALSIFCFVVVRFEMHCRRYVCVLYSQCSRDEW
jgi:hypothetical protein